MEDWGASYRNALISHWSAIDSPVIQRTSLSLHELLDRKAATAGHKRIASLLQGESLAEAHGRLREDFALRDSWLLTRCVLAERLFSMTHAAQHKGLLEILEYAPVSALLLPESVERSGARSIVRPDTALQASIAASLLALAFRVADRDRTEVPLERLVNRLLNSDFGDPRTPVPSSAWQCVKEVEPNSYARLLTMLAEQDLDVFFSHAMNEPDRRAFWLRYLGEIERTGCVLDRSVRARLHNTLVATPGLRGAIDRSFGFTGASNVQAFFLVFRDYVVVEFSDRGNAAYVYPKRYFAEKLEPRIRGNEIDSVRDLKDKREVAHRLLHQSSWQASASEWLSQHGIHDRKRALLL